MGVVYAGAAKISHTQLIPNLQHLLLFQFCRIYPPPNSASAHQHWSGASRYSKPGLLQSPLSALEPWPGGYYLLFWYWFAPEELLLPLNPDCRWYCYSNPRSLHSSANPPQSCSASPSAIHVCDHYTVLPLLQQDTPCSIIQDLCALILKTSEI